MLPYKYAFRVQDVYAITEKRGGATYKTEKVGEVVSETNFLKWPVRRQHALIVVKS